MTEIAAIYNTYPTDKEIVAMSVYFDEKNLYTINEICDIIVSNQDIKEQTK